MAGITTAVKLNDQMTAPLRNITNAVNMMLSSWESLDSATAGGLDMGDVGAIRTQLHGQRLRWISSETSSRSLTAKSNMVLMR